MMSDQKVHVLYKVTNSGTDSGLYNAFEMPRGSGVTLAAVKQHCVALRFLNHVGADGYHWRVRVDEKSASHSNNSGTGKPVPQFSWWDIQDENARLPVKEATLPELAHMFGTAKAEAPSTNTDPLNTVSGAASGAMRTLGKAMNKVALVVDGAPPEPTYNGPRIGVITFKLLDMIKVGDKFAEKHGPAFHAVREPRVKPGQPDPPTRATPSPQVQAQAQRRVQQSGPVTRPSAPAPVPAVPRYQTASTNVPRVSPPNRPPQQATATPQRRPAPVGSLMDFGPSPTQENKIQPIPETRAEQLKQEYEKKKLTENRVWDEIDQRWVVVDATEGSSNITGATQSAPPGIKISVSTRIEKKVVGITIDPANAVGKTAHVQAAVHARVNEMRASQQKALQEVRERENAKKKGEAEEDVWRQKLDPKIKAWSEEHGKKKQIRALLSSLHTILWPEASWKPVNLGDILDDKKCKICYFKASRVVHPDKTMDLDAERRFLAKRIFDALSQAKTEFDG